MVSATGTTTLLITGYRVVIVIGNTGDRRMGLRIRDPALDA
jgi:hypothetical protein